ncbi:hypothetical protein, partial [Streptomyces sp. WAC05858]|uniref:hypothetical protein n=1 Tax=Streptomyces sp. WAC05858 TaxID=2487409 RepID=UPI001C8E2422
RAVRPRPRPDDLDGAGVRPVTGRRLDHRAAGGAVEALADELIAAAIGSSPPGSRSGTPRSGKGRGGEGTAGPARG